MKSTLQKLSVLVLLTAIIASCSVQKRRYNKGWHIDWTASHAKTNKKEEAKPIKAYQPKTTQQTPVEVATTLSPETKPAKQSAPVITAEAAKAQAHTEASPAETTAAKAQENKPASLKAAKFKAIDTAYKIKDGVDDNTDLLGMLSFIFALVGLVTGLGFLLAIIFGAIALNRYKAGRGSPDKKIFAELGFWIGIIALILALLILLIVIALVI